MTAAKMKSNLKKATEATNHWLYDSLIMSRRLLPALVISLVVLYVRRYEWLAPTDPILLVAHRASLATIGFCVAHIVRVSAFPYLDLSVEVEEGRIGTPIMIGLIYMAFVLGCTLGF